MAMKYKFRLSIMSCFVYQYARGGGGGGRYVIFKALELFALQKEKGALHVPTRNLLCLEPGGHCPPDGGAGIGSYGGASLQLNSSLFLIVVITRSAGKELALICHSLVN